MATTITALVAFAAWYLLLTLAMAGFRARLMVAGGREPNSFAPDGSDTPGLGRRLTRARDNCFESLPVFAALALAASASGRLDVTDPLAMWVVYARVGQSVTHVISASNNAVRVRAAFFVVQVAIYLWWTLQLLG